MANRIQLRRDTAANWLSTNPVLADGEPGLEYDTGKIKYGDGNTNWFSLAYAAGGATTVTDFEVDGNLYFKAPGDNSDPVYITKADQTNNLSVMEIYIGDDGSTNINSYYPEDGATDYLAIKSTNAGLHHLFGSDGTYRNAGGIYFGDNTFQNTAFTGGEFYSNAAVASYLAHYDGELNFTASPAIISGAETISTVNLSGPVSPQVGTIVNNIETWAGAGAPYTYVWIGSIPNFLSAYNLGDLTGWVFYPTGHPEQAVTVTSMNPVGVDSLGFDGSLPNGPTYTAHSPDYAPGTPQALTVAIDSHNWTFGTDGSLTFPDGTAQTTAFELQGLPPSTAWGAAYPAGPGVANLDYQFFFDGGIGYPTMQSYASAGGNPLYNSIWSIESVINGAPAYTSSGATPVQVNNTGGVNLLGSALQPGDYIIVRIQNIDTGRIYRATFMGSYNAADIGNEVKYGSITVERLL